MTNNNQVIVIVGIILAVLLASKLGFFSIFSQPDNSLKLTQYVSEKKCWDLGGGWYWPSVCDRTYQGYWINGIPSNTKFSNTAEIIVDGHTFKFDALKASYADNLEGFTHTGYPYGDHTYGCFQEVKVYRDSTLIDTIRSWNGTDSTNINNGVWKGDKRTYYTDVTKKIGITFEAVDSSFYHVGTSCIYFKNVYNIVVADDIVNYIIDYSLSNNTLTLEVDSINNLESQIIGRLKLNISIPTIIGKQSKLFEQDVLLVSGKNEFNLSFPMEDLGDIKLEAIPQLEMVYTGAQFSGLNYFKSTELTASCSQWSPAQNRCEAGTLHESNYPMEIISSDLVPVGTFNYEPIQLKIVNGQLLPDSDNSTSIVYTNNTIIVEKIVEKEPSLFGRFGIASLVLIGVITFFIWRSTKN